MEPRVPVATPGLAPRSQVAEGLFFRIHEFNMRDARGVHTQAASPSGKWGGPHKKCCRIRE